MTTVPPDPAPSTDPWLEWLHRRRHGNDLNYRLVVLERVKGIRDHVLDGAGPLSGKLLVDVGGGDGLIAFGALERAGSSLSAVLVDPSQALLNRAEQLAVERGVRNQCTFLQTSAEKLEGVADGSADVVTTRAVLAYVADKPVALRQFHRVLKRGGRLSIAEPIYRDEALYLAAFSNSLLATTAEKISPQIRLLHRCRAAQLASTVEEIQSNPLTNFSERDLIALSQDAGFDRIHLELHIDIRKEAAMPWDTFIDIAPRPSTPTLREVFAAHLSGSEQRLLEDGLRPMVESGQYKTRDTTAYLTACKQK